MAQMKEQIKTPEKELNQIEIENLSDAEFKTPVVMMFKNLGPQQHKTDPLINEGYTNWNKEQFTGKQQ